MLKPLGTVPSDVILYMQGLLQDWQSLSQQVSHLSDQAALRFNNQQHTSQDSAALLTSTMAMIADATTAAQRLQEKYVQQAVLFEASKGDQQWSCDRGNSLAAHFELNRWAGWWMVPTECIKTLTTHC
jgi:hypothetical protein